MPGASFYTAQVTPEGFAKLNTQLSKLKEQYLSLINDLKGSEDTPDTAVLRTEMMLAQSAVMNKIKSFERIIASARLVNSHEVTRVGIGCTVELADETGKTLRVTIVESIEADPFEHRISADSPLGRAIFGKQSGEEISYVRPNGARITYVIKEIT